MMFFPYCLFYIGIFLLPLTIGENIKERIVFKLDNSNKSEEDKAFPELITNSVGHIVYPFSSQNLFYNSSQKETLSLLGNAAMLLASLFVLGKRSTNMYNSFDKLDIGQKHFVDPPNEHRHKLRNPNRSLQNTKPKQLKWNSFKNRNRYSNKNKKKKIKEKLPIRKETNKRRRKRRRRRKDQVKFLTTTVSPYFVSDPHSSSEQKRFRSVLNQPRKNIPLFTWPHPRKIKKRKSNFRRKIRTTTSPTWFVKRTGRPSISKRRLDLDYSSTSYIDDTRVHSLKKNFSTLANSQDSADLYDDNNLNSFSKRQWYDRLFEDTTSKESKTIDIYDNKMQKRKYKVQDQVLKHKKNKEKKMEEKKKFFLPTPHSLIKKKDVLERTNPIFSIQRHFAALHKIKNSQNKNKTRQWMTLTNNQGKKSMHKLKKTKRVLKSSSRRTSSEKITTSKNSEEHLEPETSWKMPQAITNKRVQIDDNDWSKPFSLAFDNFKISQID